MLGKDFSMSEGIFEKITKSALKEIVLKYAWESKYGYLVSNEELEELINDLYMFVKNSRDLKDSGDKFLSNLGTQESSKELSR